MELLSTHAPGGSSSRLYRSRSVSVLPGRTTRSRAPSVDPLSGVSRGRDDDFKKTMQDKVSRLTRALSVKPLSVGASEEFASRGTSNGRFLRRRPSVSDLLPDRTSTLEAGLAAGGGADFISRWTAVKYGGAPSAQPTVDKTLSIDKILLPATIAANRNRTLLDDDVDNVAARGQRISSLLEQLRHADGPNGLPQNDLSARAVHRAEVDSFAALLSKLSFPSLERQGETRRSRQSLPYNTLGGAEDFYSRLAHARGDLNRVEGLASKAFNWEEKPNKWFSGSLPQRQQQIDGITEVKTTNKSPTELFTFFTDKERDIGHHLHSTSAADQAVRWAQQRRIMVENELEHERHREKYKHPSFTTNEYIVNETSAPTPRINSYDDYADDAYTFTPHYVATVVRPSTARGSSVLANSSNFEIERPTLSYGRSISASNLDFSGPGRQKSQQNFKPPISEARQRVRAALCKSKNDPNYFDHRSRDE